METQEAKPIYLVVTVIAIFIVLIIAANFKKSPKLSDDPRIAELQKQAIDLDIYKKVCEMRFNAKQLFKYKWSYDFRDYTENNVTFRSTNGRSEIEYQSIIVKMIDAEHIRIYYNNSKVYEAIANWDSIFYSLNEKTPREITTFIPGPWIDIFCEMYDNAMIGPFIDTAGILEKKWGIGG